MMQQVPCTLPVLVGREHCAGAHDLELALEGRVLNDEELEHRAFFLGRQRAHVAHDFATKFAGLELLVVGRKDVPEPGQIHAVH
jgi:hypothetical protein